MSALTLEGKGILGGWSLEDHSEHSARRTVVEDEATIARLQLIELVRELDADRTISKGGDRELTITTLRAVLPILRHDHPGLELWRLDYSSF